MKDSLKVSHRLDEPNPVKNANPRPTKSALVQRRLYIWLTGPAFSYASILALQLRVMWGFWAGRDVTSGDTSSYAVAAYRMAKSLGNTFNWAPLYAAFYGTVLRVTGDIVSATLVHRVLVVFVLACLVLALARQLLPAPVAWLIAAWWVVLPVNFNSLYEAHLFSAILPLGAALVLALRQDRASRAMGLLLLLLSAALVRNEYSLAFGALALCCVVYEIRQYRKAETPGRIRMIALPYSAYLMIAAIVIFGFLIDSRVRGEELAASFDSREELVVCQLYAVGYLQRHPEWQQNPFEDCQQLMKAEFSQVPPSYLAAAQLNPGAFLEHLIWNVRLIPAGIQLAFFNEISGDVSPDYIPVRQGSGLATLLSAIVVATVIWGALSLRRDRYLWLPRLRNRSWAWTALVCCSLVAVPIMLLLRPRPAFFIPFNVTIMLGVGLCIAAILARFNLTKGLALILPLVLANLLLLAPTPYIGAARPLHDAYYRLLPSASLVGNGTVALAPGYSVDLCNYLLPDQPCQILEYNSKVRPKTSSASLNEQLATENIQLIYADSGMLADPIFQAEFQPTPSGWSLQAGDLRSSDPWVILVRQQP